MKNINFQVKFHVFCMFEKKACFIPILVNHVGLTEGLIITTMDQMRSSSKPAWAGKVHTKGSYWDTSCRCPADVLQINVLQISSLDRWTRHHDVRRHGKTTNSTH